MTKFFQSFKKGFFFSNAKVTINRVQVCNHLPVVRLVCTLSLQVLTCSILIEWNYVASWDEERFGDVFGKYFENEDQLNFKFKVLWFWSNTNTKCGNSHLTNMTLKSFLYTIMLVVKNILTERFLTQMELMNLEPAIGSSQNTRLDSIGNNHWSDSSSDKVKLTMSSSRQLSGEELPRPSSAFFGGTH